MRKRRTTPRLALASAATLALLPLTSCSAPPHATQLPDGITIAVYQSRLDANENKFEISVTNNSGTEITITRLEFDSPAFAHAMAYDRTPSTVADGRTIDFRIDLAAPNCDAEPGSPSVAIGFTHAGHTGTATVQPTDRFDQLPTITAEHCLTEHAEAIAHLEFSTNPIERATIAGRDVALLTLTITPNGGDDNLTLNSISDTPLLSILNPASGTIVETLPLGLTITGTDNPSTATIPVVQSRCDQHSVADDKKGTLFPLDISTPRGSGTLTLKTSEKTRSELFQYLGDVCHWG